MYARTHGAAQVYQVGTIVPMHLVVQGVYESDTVHTFIDAGRNRTFQLSAAVENSIRGGVAAVIDVLPSKLPSGEHTFAVEVRDLHGGLLHRLEQRFQQAFTTGAQLPPPPLTEHASVHRVSRSTFMFSSVCLSPLFELLYFPDPGAYNFPPLAPVENVQLEARCRDQNLPISISTELEGLPSSTQKALRFQTRLRKFEPWGPSLLLR